MIESISFAICTHNESSYIKLLLSQLITFLKMDRSDIKYEIVIVDDNSTDVETLKIFDEYQNKINLFKHSLNGDFSAHKNFMNSKCQGQWILNLDADENINLNFLAFISDLIDANPKIDAYWVPRINKVYGLTLKDVQKWGWVLTKFDDFINISSMDHNEEYDLLKQYNFIINEDNDVVTYYEPIINWPDFQMRLYKNDPNIKWTKKVHEQLVGFSNYGILPQKIEFSIQHFKDINRQKKQNEFYQTL